MNNYQIIALILTSSVLSAFITVCFQWVFKFLDYRLDYKKKVIDKRINAYENINLITWQLGLITHDGEKAWSGVFSSKNDFDDFVVKLVLLRKNQIWLSERLVDELQLCEVSDFVPFQHYISSTLIELSLKLKKVR